jgi:hypothetical protein
MIKIIIIHKPFKLLAYIKGLLTNPEKIKEAEL